MQAKKVLSEDNLPARLPLFQTLTLWLFLREIHAPQWVWGSLGVLFLVFWIGAVCNLIREDRVDIFRDGK